MTAGKGDRIRPYNRKRWDEGWDRAFGERSCEHPRQVRIQRFFLPMWMCTTCGQIVEER